MSALEANNIGGGIHAARFIGNTSFNDTALWVDGTLAGDMNDSAFIANKAALPNAFPASALQPSES